MLSHSHHAEIPKYKLRVQRELNLVHYTTVITVNLLFGEDSEHKNRIHWNNTQARMNR